MALILTDEQKVSCTVAFTTAAGNPATVDGVPAWSSSDETICTVAASDDGMSAVVTTVGALGTCQISCTGDADRGAGVRPVTATLDVEVQAAEAVTAGISAGTPETK